MIKLIKRSGKEEFLEDKVYNSLISVGCMHYLWEY